MDGHEQLANLYIAISSVFVDTSMSRRRQMQDSWSDVSAIAGNTQKLSGDTLRCSERKANAGQ